MKTKLKIGEYTLEIDNKDILNVEAIYNITKLECHHFEKNKKTNITYRPIIYIELQGNDKDNNPSWISFNINTDLNYLNTLSNIPNDITNLLGTSEAFIKKPDKEESEYLNIEIPKNNIEDIYINLSSLWISKITNNKFIFKLSVSNEVFTYFTIDFS